VSERAAGSVQASGLQQLAAIALGLAALAFVALRMATSPDVPLIRQSSERPWIGPPLPVSASLQQWGRDAAPLARFEQRLTVAEPSGAELRVRALRRFRAFLNGRQVLEGDGADWRRDHRTALALAAGENELRVEVSNPHGPPLLSLRLEAPGGPLVSDETWRVAVDDGPAELAARADDTRPNPTSLATETPARAARERADTLLGLFLLGALVFGVGETRARDSLVRALPLLMLAAAAAGWTLWLLTRVVYIPPQIGFDARHHLAYVELLRSQGRVPLATDGWSTFHPPLFYALCAAAGRSATALKLLPWLGGLGAVAAVFWLARRMFADDPRAQLLAVGFAAVLPMNLYSAAYFSNESLHTALSGLAVAGTVALLLGRRLRPAAVAGVGLLFGLAALTKFTVLLVAPLALLLLLARARRIDAGGWRHVAGIGLAFALPLLAVCGWYYARNVQVFGTPLAANWGDLPGRIWWQQPGFHTPAYYAGFGQALVHPYLSGFTSFWDSAYSTFWGDGFVAGRVSAADRHGFWSYDFMSAGYLLALPATVLIAAGGLLALRGAFTHPDPRRRAALSLLTASSGVVGLAFLYLTLRMPFFAQAKATYTLVLAGPFSIFFALAAARLDDALTRYRPARLVFWGWLTCWAGTLFLGFTGPPG
jgi:hypothetical protein